MLEQKHNIVAHFWCEETSGGVFSARFGDYLTALPDYLAARDRYGWPTGYVHPFVGCEVSCVVQGGASNRCCAAGSPDRDGGIGARSEDTFARLEPVQARGAGGCERYAGVDVEFMGGGGGLLAAACGRR